MARVTVEDCIDKIPNRYELLMVATQRAKDISAGSPIMVARDNDKNPVIALREIAEEKTNIEDLQRSLVMGLQKFVEIEEPEEEEMEILAAEKELSDLEDGWLDCGGRAISKCGAKKISDLFTRFYDDKLPLPHIFPTEVGNLQAEWSFKSKEVLLKINLETLGAECTIIDIERDSDEEHILDLSDEKDWSEFNSIILESSDEK